MAAGTVVITEEQHSTIKKIKFAWVSGDGAEVGTASGQTTFVYSGKILGLATDPDATAPTDNYTITITDGDSMDVLMGAAVGNRDTANTEYILSTSLGAVANDKLTINVSSAGTNKIGIAYLYIR